jgi:hypothetical protein
MSRSKSKPIRKIPTVWNIETPKTKFNTINDIELKYIRKKFKVMTTQDTNVDKLQEIIRPYNEYVIMILDGEIDKDLPRPLLTIEDIKKKYEEFYTMDPFPKLNDRITEMTDYLKRFFIERIIPGVLIRYGEGRKMTENVGRDICIHFVEEHKEM